MRFRTQAGVTLIEMVVVIAIVGVLAGLSVAALNRLKSQPSFANEAAEVEAALRRARAEAFSRGLRTAFVIDTEGHRWWTVEAPGGFDLSTFNPGAPAGLITSGAFSRVTPLTPPATTFGPQSGYGKALAAPFARVPVLASEAPNRPFCSFCLTGGSLPGFGFVEFEAGGAPRFSGGPAAVGQQFTITGASDVGSRTRVFVIVAHTGMLDTLED
jgi:general secretion pathway protein H